MILFGQGKISLSEFFLQPFSSIRGIKSKGAYIFFDAPGRIRVDRPPGMEERV